MVSSQRSSEDQKKCGSFSIKRFIAETVSGSLRFCGAVGPTKMGVGNDGAICAG